MDKRIITIRVEWYRKAAEKGDAKAQYVLGEALMTGQGVPKDFKQAEQWYQKASEDKEWHESVLKKLSMLKLLQEAETGTPETIFKVGVSFHKGERGVYSDKELALQFYENAAKQGYAEAQFTLGTIYGGRCRDFEINSNDEHNKKLTVEWYQKAAEQGHIEAQYYLGCELEYPGYMIEKFGNKKEAIDWIIKAAVKGYVHAQAWLGSHLQDRKLAAEWRRKAAEQGDAWTQYYLGGAFETGDGIAIDLKQAAEWYRKAGEQGNRNAQIKLAKLLTQGLGIPKDLSQAAAWYRKAAEQRDAEAQFRLGEILEKGQGVSEDKKQAEEWYQKAAENGYAEAQFKLGEKFSKGIGVVKDLRNAVNWYEKAAKQGHAEAQNEFGVALWKGEGTYESKSTAVDWFQKAASQGCINAHNNLGVAYAVGKGVSKDLKLSAEWYRKAAEKGHLVAQYELGELLEKGEGVPQDLKEAAEWYRKSAEQGDVEAQFKLGEMFEKAKGVPRDIRQAAEWYRKAGEQGNEKARMALLSLQPLLLSFPTSASSPSTIGGMAVTSSHTSEFAEKKEIQEKIWHFDASLKPDPDMMKEGYALIPAGDKDLKKVLEAYSHCPVPGYDIGSVRIIYNSELNRTFAGRLRLLQGRHGNPAFQPKWATENENEWRGDIHKLFEKMTTSYQDKDTPNVKLLPVWHGTKPEILSSLFKTGFANLALVDSGYFGKGIYGAYEAEYSHRVYSKGALLLNWCAAFSAYPVIDGDMIKLQGQPNYANYDAHFVPVLPEFPDDPHPESYIPCKPGQRPQCTEVVVFESSQMLPRYLVELQASLVKTPSVSESEKTSGNSAMLYSYLASSFRAKAKAKSEAKGQEKIAQAKAGVV